MQHRKSLRHKRQRLRLANGTGWLIPAVSAVMAMSAAAALFHS